MIFHEDEQFIRGLPQTSCASLSKFAISKANKQDALIKNIENFHNEQIYNTLAKRLDDDDFNPSLMYGSAILVSTNTNLNDDLFLPEELWAARKTPINTPYNEEHVKPDIFGHIFDANVITADGEVIDDSKEIEIPKYFDILVDFVIYESIFPELAASIAEKAPKNETFVSMECFFNNFDYALLKSDGTIDKIIQRNTKTSFLTKKLRIYKGEGKYNGQKIVRVLRNIIFKGMANVAEPANIKSEYKKIDEFVEANCKNTNDRGLDHSVLFITKGNIMKVENLEQAEKLIKDLNDKVAQYEKEKNESVANQKIGELEKSVKTLTDNLAAANTKADLASQESKKHSDRVAELEKEIKDTKASLDEKVKELDKINLEAKKSQRFQELATLKIELSDEQKASIGTMTDESFKSIVDFVKPLVKTNPVDGKEQTDQVNDATTQASKTLNKAEEEKKKGLETSKEQTVDNKYKEAAARLVKIIKKTKNDKSEDKK